MRITPNYSFLIRVSALLASGSLIASGILTWLVWRHAAVVPLWGQKSMTSHLLLMSLAMSFLVSVLASWLTVKALRHRKIFSLHWHLKNLTMLDRLPADIIPRALIIGLMGCCYAFLLVFLLSLFTDEKLLRTEFLKLNMFYSFWLATGAAILSIYRTLGTVPRR